MTFKQKYHNALKWQHKVIVMYLYSLAKPHFTVKEIARYFDVSVGLVSENLFLGSIIGKIKQEDSRRSALKRFKK